MKAIQTTLLLIIISVINHHNNANSKIITETIYGTLSEKTDNIGEGYDIGKRYELFTITYDDESTVMHIYNMDGSIASTIDSGSHEFDFGDDALYVIAPFLVGFIDTYCVTPTGTTTYLDWHYELLDEGVEIYQRVDEYSTLELEMYLDDSKSDYGEISGNAGSVSSFIKFNKIERVPLNSPIVEATVNGLDCFQIEGDPRIWLDLDNPNILDRSYNEIKSWAKENNFRFATKNDLDDLIRAVLPLGDVFSPDWSDEGIPIVNDEGIINEAYYTEKEREAIGLTFSYRSYAISTGYTVTDYSWSGQLTPINYTAIGTYSKEPLLYTSYSESSTIDGAIYLSGDIPLERFSAWLISDNVLKAINYFYSPVYENHYFTGNEDETNYIIDNWSEYWEFVAPVWYAFLNPKPGTTPLYHFYAPSNENHYYTINEDEKNYIMKTWPWHWQYVGVTCYVYSSNIPGTNPIYHFYSYQADRHYFSYGDDEKEYIMKTWPNYWTYIGVAWYAFQYYSSQY